MDNPWLNFKFGADNNVCPGDAEPVFQYNDQKKNEDHVLDLSLAPEPYVGDLNNCTLLILMANPGWSVRDKTEHQEATFQKLALSNLRQELSDWPFYLLNPKLRKYSGGEYWLKRLEGFRQHIADSEGLDRETALHEVSRRVAVAELHPYHSKKFDKAAQLLDLPSSKFTHSLVDKAIKRGCKVLVARGVSLWDERLLNGLPDTFFTLRSSQASGAIKPENLIKSSLRGVDLGSVLEQ